MALDERVESFLAEAVIGQLISETQSTKDRCAVSSCKVETEYDKSTHISQRQFYIEGVGQLCKPCYVKVYDQNEIVDEY